MSGHRRPLEPGLQGRSARPAPAGSRPPACRSGPAPGSSPRCATRGPAPRRCSAEPTMKTDEEHDGDARRRRPGPAPAARGRPSRPPAWRAAAFQRSMVTPLPAAGRAAAERGVDAELELAVGAPLAHALGAGVGEAARGVQAGHDLVDVLGRVGGALQVELLVGDVDAVEAERHAVGDPRRQLGQHLDGRALGDGGARHAAAAQHRDGLLVVGEALAEDAGLGVAEHLVDGRLAAREGEDLHRRWRRRPAGGPGPTPAARRVDLAPQVLEVAGEGEGAAPQVEPAGPAAEVAAQRRRQGQRQPGACSAGIRSAAGPGELERRHRALDLGGQELRQAGQAGQAAAQLEAGHRRAGRRGPARPAGWRAARGPAGPAPAQRLAGARVAGRGGQRGREGRLAGRGGQERGGVGRRDAEVGGQRGGQRVGRPAPGCAPPRAARRR